MRDQVRILLIEDSPTYAHLIRIMLVEIDSMSVEAVWADHLAAGLERLTEGGIDLILLDLVLPDSQGLDTFVRAHAHAPDLPIVVLSSLEDESLAAQIIQQGAQDYLVKGWTDSRLLGRSIRYALERHGLQTELTARTRALWVSEERHRSLVENVHVAIVTHATDTRIVFSNPAACKLLDLTEAQMLGREAMDPRWRFLREDGSTLPLEDHPVRQVVSTDRPLQETVYGIVRPTTGDTIWALVSATPIRDAPGEIVEVVVTYVDITELRRAEEQLRVSEIRFRELFDHMSSGCAVYRAVDDGQDLIFVDFNRAGERIDQVQRDDLIGRSVAEIFPGVKAFGLWDVFERVWRTGQPEHLPISLYHDDRIAGWRENYVFRLPSGEIVALYDDVTERRQNEEALRDSRRMLQAVLDSIPAAVFWKDRDSIYLGGNRTWLATVGLKSSQEAVGKSDYDLPWEKGQADLFREYDRKVMESGIPEYDIIEPYLRADGTRAWAKINKVPLQGMEDNVVGILGTYEDITERKWAEEKLKEYSERLEEMVEERTAELRAVNAQLALRSLELREINAELEAFAYSVSHDLRAPLRAINGFAQIIAHRHRDDLNEQGQHYFDNIVQASAHMGQLIDDLLSYSRLGRKAIRCQAVSLADLLAQVTGDLAGRVAQLGAQLSLPAADDLPILNSDPTLLGQILTNLLDNALTYHQPGTIPQVSVGCVVEGNNAVISVADKGIGIAPEFHDKIFHIFQRLHSQDQYPGTGIGLAMVRKSVALLGGRAWVESVLGEGSTFYVELPVGAEL